MYPILHSTRLIVLCILLSVPLVVASKIKFTHQSPAQSLAPKQPKGPECKCPPNYKFNCITRMCYPDKSALKTYAENNNMKLCCVFNPITGQCDPYLCPPGYKCADKFGRHHGGCEVDEVQLARYAKKNDLKMCRTNDRCTGECIYYLCGPCYRCCSSTGDCVFDCKQQKRPKCRKLLRKLVMKQMPAGCRLRNIGCCTANSQYRYGSRHSRGNYENLCQNYNAELLNASSTQYGLDQVCSGRSDMVDGQRTMSSCRVPHNPSPNCSSNFTTS